MGLIFMVIALIFCLMVGVPAFFSMGLSTLLYFIVERGLHDIPDVIMAQRTLFGLDSFALLSVPLFLFVGRLMNESGVTNRLFDFAKSLVGHFRGGLGQVNIAASVIFAGMSGSATADAAGLGAVEIKAMRDANYPKDFACAITASSSLIGPIIPPSVPVVIYAIVAGVSVNQLLIAGIIPGLLMAIALSIFVTYSAIKNNYPTEKKASFSQLIETGKRAFLSLMTPVILIGGILSGVFTATEAAAIGALYAIILACLIYRNISLNRLYQICRHTMIDTGVIMIIFAVSNIFAWILTREKVPVLFADVITSFTDNYYLVMLLIFIFLIILGMFLSSIVSITISTPVLIPLIVAVGGDPLHFGIIMIVTLMIGELTPPFGMVLFAVTRVGDISFMELVKAVTPYILPIVAITVVLIIFPQLVTILPEVFLGK